MLLKFFVAGSERRWKAAGEEGGQRGRGSSTPRAHCALASACDARFLCLPQQQQQQTRCSLQILQFLFFSFCVFFLCFSCLHSLLHSRLLLVLACFGRVAVWLSGNNNLALCMKYTQLIWCSNGNWHLCAISMRIATTDGAHKLPDKVQRGGRERGRGTDKGSGRAGDRSKGSQACPGWSNSMQMAKTSCKCKQVRGQKNRNALLRTDAASCKCNNEATTTSQVGSTECQACYSHRYSPCIHSTNHYTFAIFTFVLRCLFTSFLFFFFVLFFVFMFNHLTPLCTL